MRIVSWVTDDAEVCQRSVRRRVLRARPAPRCGLAGARSAGSRAGRGHHHAELQGRGLKPDHSGGGRGHRQELHHRSAGQRQSDHAVGDAHVARRLLRGVPRPCCRFTATSRCRPARSSRSFPNTDARQLPSIDLPSNVSSTSDEIVTQIITMKNINAAQLVPLLRPLIPQQGHLAAYPSRQHADHLGPREQREPHHEDHRAHGRKRRRADRGRAAAQRERHRTRAHGQPAQPGRRPPAAKAARRSSSSPTSAPTAC